MSNILLSEKKNKLNNFFPQSMESLEFENNPSISIVKNFELIINYIEDKKLKLSENRLFLQPKDLFQLNLQLLKPIEIDIQKPQPSSLPHVNAIFWLLRTTKIVKILRIKNNLFMEINHDILNEWITLNKTEQYCTLLDAWLVSAKSILIDNNRGTDSIAMFNCVGEFLRMPQIIDVSGDNIASHNYLLGMYNLALFEMFGFLKIKHEEPNPGKGWNYSHIEKTELGISIIAILSNAFNLNDEMSIFLSSFNITRFNRSKFFNIESKSFSKLKPYLQKFIPRWQKSLSVKKRGFVDGTYTFSASYEEEKYIFTFDAKQSLELFADQIISKFDLDSDHLYEFICKDIDSGGKLRIVHDYMKEEPYRVSSFSFGELPLNIGEEMIFHHDFGDDIRIKVTLDGIKN